jgi:hypothetical protein
MLWHRPRLTHEDKHEAGFHVGCAQQAGDRPPRAPPAPSQGSSAVCGACCWRRTAGGGRRKGGGWGEGSRQGRRRAAELCPNWAQARDRCRRRTLPLRVKPKAQVSLIPGGCALCCPPDTPVRLGPYRPGNRKIRSPAASLSSSLTPMCTPQSAWRLCAATPGPHLQPRPVGIVYTSLQSMWIHIV